MEGSNIQKKFFLIFDSPSNTGFSGILRKGNFKTFALLLLHKLLLSEWVKKKWVVLYNTKLSYRNTKKTHFHTNAIITQNILNFFSKLTIFEISFERSKIF